MPLGKQLTKEEIEAIQHQITPIHRIHRISQSTTYLSSEQCPSYMSRKTRGEFVDKGSKR